MKKSITCIACLFLITNIYSQESEAVSKGKAIGQTIKAAADVIVPGITPIVELIFGSSEAKRVKKADLESDLKQQATKVKGQVLDKVKPLGDLATEIAIYNQFLSPTIEARGHLYRMDVELAKAKIDWDNVKEEWSLASASIDKITSVSDSEIDKVSGLYGKEKLKNVKTNSSKLKSRMKSRLARKIVGGKEAEKVALVRDILGKFIKTLSATDFAVGILLGDLQSGFSALYETDVKVQDKEIVNNFKKKIEGLPMIENLNAAEVNALSIDELKSLTSKNLFNLKSVFDVKQVEINTILEKVIKE
ncbi:MAG: hypothetical protein AAF600_02745 [Bacteroidota bacterium]